MENIRPLTVKIFRDSLGPDIDLEAIESGVSTLQEVAACLRVVSSGSRAYLPDSEEYYIRADILKPKAFGADLGIVATRRALLTAENLDKNRNVKSYRLRDKTANIGLSFNVNSIKAPKLALVRVDEVTESVQAEQTTTHELAHLLNVKKEGANHDHQGHCTDRQCVMSEEVYISKETGEFIVPDKFCTECKTQVRENAFTLRDIKAHKRVSDRRRAKLLLPKSM
jgi:hypothetical protein